MEDSDLLQEFAKMCSIERAEAERLAAEPRTKLLRELLMNVAGAVKCNESNFEMSFYLLTLAESNIHDIMNSMIRQVNEEIKRRDENGKT